ncbi:MAG TPA: DUF1565 domain-containing protein, partial [Polyangiaceae bacterium]
MRFTRFHVSGALLAFFAPLAAHATTYFVAPNGSDTADGSMGTPFATMNHANSIAKAGDVFNFRAGTYTYAKAETFCGGGASDNNQTATVVAITLGKSGSAGNLITYQAYQNELPILSFSGIKNDCRVKGLNVTGSYIYLKGLEITGV